MTVALVGEVVNACDATTGFNNGNISGDDDFVEGSGAIGEKVSATTLEMYTTSLGASAPYDFSSGGGEEGFHIIMWFNSKSPINATAGFRVAVGDGTNRGHWNVVPRTFYKGGFVTQVVDAARDFDSIAAGSWTTGGNPAQLTGVSQVGGVMQTAASIMGNFNNFQLDQMTVGLGLRVDAGTVGTPNTFEIVRAADEDTNFWGWWSSAFGAIVAKGKLFIGPATGSATSVFDDSAFSVIFADERVAGGFYEINIRGGGTDVVWDLASIVAANPTNARWTLTVQSDANSFSDTNGVWKGADQLVLSLASTLDGTTFINCSKLIQNGAALDGCAILSANTADGVAFIESDDPEAISNTVFFFSDGHAIELTTPGTYDFTGNTFSGYGSDGTNDAAIYNNSGGAVTLNVIGGTAPTVRNGAGASTTLVINPVTLTVKAQDQSTGAPIVGARALVLADNGGGFLGGASVTITRSGSTATVAHTGHGFVTGNQVRIRGANEAEYNGLFTITVTGPNEYTYTVSGTPATPATGTIVSALVVIDAITDSSGEVTDTRSWGADQDFTGRIHRSTGSTTYKTQPVSGTIDSAAGLSTTAQMIADE